MENIIENADFKSTYIKALFHPLKLESALYTSILNETQVIHGENFRLFDLKACQENNIPVYNLRYFHQGAILGFKGDLCILYVGKNFKEQTQKLLNRIINFLKAHNIDASQNGNDIIITEDGHPYKIAGSVTGFTPLALKGMGGIFININSDIDLIKKICLKPMVKIPLSLSKYGITAQDIIDDIKLM